MRTSWRKNPGARRGIISTAAPAFRPEGRKAPRPTPPARARDRAAPDRRLRGLLARLRAGPERMRSPLHLLHHTVRTRKLALGAAGRGRHPRSEEHTSELQSRV